ncbi:MAG TPA: hypothetical protein VMZ29_01115 [Candidatus Bathyarchaeia archaeon]|nr:hypothetical protein [Candidatus Bathyarchaeia archaeon]
MSQQIRQLGQTYKDISTWTWLTIFLFWLIFPPIVLLVKEFQLASELKAAGQANNDQQLVAFGDRELLIIILDLASMVVGVTGLIALILQIIQLGEQKTWAMNRNVPLAAEGYGQIRTGILLSLFLFWLVIPLIIGMIMVPIGYRKVGDALSP